MRRIGNWAVAVAALVLLASVGMTALSDPPWARRPTRRLNRRPDTAAAAQPSPQAPASGYVGTETCVGCHTGYDGTINQTKHGFAANARTPMATSRAANRATARARPTRATRRR